MLFEQKGGKLEKKRGRRLGRIVLKKVIPDRGKGEMVRDG